MDTLSRRELFKKYSYGLVNTDDIDELQNIFDYASGIIVKDSDMADKYETTVSARNGNTYVKACYKQDDYTDAQREKLKGMYEESNQYYRWLLDEYNIDPLTSRTAEDYDILKSISATDNNGKALLTEYQEELFIRCYKEALHYWNNVTRTKSFKNEEMYRQFSEVYLLFMTIQRYITYRMKSQFDVDTFNKFQCKNYFISNGVDYFDSLPLNYQRRLIKLLNDMQRDKGDDTVFNYIKDVLMVDNLNIYKYVLAKHQPTGDSKGELVFYKVPYDEELNTDTNEIYSFESITEDDPYWRASKDEVLYQTFNTLDTKYISVEYVVDMIKNGNALSYFMYLLNDSMLIDKNAGDKTSLRFFDKNISSNPIQLYDAMMALYSLFYTYIKNDQFDGEPADKIDQDGDGVTTSLGKPLITNIHGYASYENDSFVKETIDDILYEIDKENSKNNTPQSIITWNNNLKDFLTVKFNLRDFYYSDNFSFEAIESYYNDPSYKKYIGNTVENVKLGSMTIKNEFLELARYINAVGYYNVRDYRSYEQAHRTFDLYKNVLNDNLKESLAYVWDLIKSQSMPLSALNIHANFKKLFKKYIAYLIINGDISSSETVGSFYTLNAYYNDHFDIFYNLMIADQNDSSKQNPILTELIDYVHEIWGYDNAYFNNFLSQYNTREGFKNFIKFINLVQHSFFTRDELYKYENLLVFLEIFTSLKKEIYTKNASIDQEITGLTNIASKYSDIKIEEFMQILNKNESVRADLEKYIRESTNRKIYNDLRKLWLIKFKSNFNFELYNEFETFKEYLLTNDDELYNFVTNFGEFSSDSDRRKEIENRILEISTSIEKFIKSDGNIVYNSTFNVIFSNIKEYAMLLIEVFKAYTLDTIYSGNILDFNDPTNERIKIFDEGPSDDEPFIEDLVFEAPPEYLDIQDDIRKDNGDMDVSYNLLVRNLVRNSLNVEGESIEDQDRFDKYLKYIKVEFKFMEAQYDLPYGITSLTEEEFNAKYGSESGYYKSGKLGFGKRQYKYIKESYDYYHNNPSIIPSNFDPNHDIWRVELNRVLSDNHIEYIYTHIVTTTEALKNRDPSVSSYIDANRTFIDINNHKIYCNTNDNDLATLFGNTRDSYTGLYCFDYTTSDENTDTRKYIAYITLDESDNKYYAYLYDFNTRKFNKRCLIGNITTYSGLTPYISNHELVPETDVEMPVYYDPNVCGAMIYGRYTINPLDNIFSDYPSNFNVKNVNYNNIDEFSDFALLTYNDDFFYKYFNTHGRNNQDMRREKLFYTRPSRAYSLYIGNPDRIPFNKRIHPIVIPIPNENYIDFLNNNNLVNNDNIYMIEYIPPSEPDDPTGPFYYIPQEIEYEEEGILKTKYILNKEQRKNNIDDLYFVIKGNEVKNIELDLGKEYYCFASYAFNDLYTMYEKIEEDTIESPENYKVYPMLTMYLKLGREITEAETNSIKDRLNLVSLTLINPNTYLYEVKGNTKGKNRVSCLVDNTKMNRLLSFFNNVGHSMNDTNNTGFDQNHPFVHIESLIDEVIKHTFFFIKNEEEGLSTILKYSHEYSNVEPKGFYEIGYGFNISNAKKTKILFEPLRYYNFPEFRDKLVLADPTLDPTDPDQLPYYRDQSIIDKEQIPYYVDIVDESIELEPSPYLYKRDKDTDLVSYPVVGDNYLRALHQNYSNYNSTFATNNTAGQFTRYDITTDKGHIFGSANNLTDYFKSIKCDGLNDVAVPDVYKFYYYYNSVKGAYLDPQDLTGLDIGGYTYSLRTSDNALKDIKLKTPPTINDNAWLLTFFNSIEKPDTDTSLTIEVDDFINNSNTFGYIAVKNKGITDYTQTPSDNTNPNNSNRPLLSAIAKLSNQLKLKSFGSSVIVSNIDGAINLVNDFTKISRFTNDIYESSTEDPFLINTIDPIVEAGNHDIENTLYDNSGNYKRLMTYNSERYQYQLENPTLYKWKTKSSHEIEPEATIIDMTEEEFNEALPEDYFRDSELIYVHYIKSGIDRYYESLKYNMENINDNEKNKQFFYDWNYIEDLENKHPGSGKETIVKSGLFKRSLSENLVDCHIVIAKNGTVLFDSHNNEEEINFYNKEYTLTNKEIFERNEEYDVFIATTIKNTGSSNGNFVCNLILDNKEGLGTSNEKIIYDTDKYGNTFAVYTAKIKPNSKSCKLKFHMAGIIIFDTIINYDFTEENSNTHELLLIAPGKDRGSSSEALIHNGSIVYFNDDDDYLEDNINESIEYMPFTYITHKFDTSTNAKKHRTVMISTGSPDSFSRKTDFNLYPYRLDENWLDHSAFNNGYIAKIGYICGQIEKTITNTINDITDDDKKLDIELTNTVKINYDFEKNLWNKEDNLFVLRVGENLITVNYDSYINRRGDSDNTVEYTIKNTSNKYIDELNLPSSIMIYGSRAFYLSTNIKNFTFSPIAVYFGSSLFNSSSIEEVYFENDALVLPLISEFGSNNDSYRDIPSNLIPNITWDIFKDIIGGSIFDGYAFSDTNEFKKYTFTIKFPYNASKINDRCFANSTINQLDFSNCKYLMYTGDSVFANEDYLNRRYVLDSNDEIVIRNDYPVYEGDYSYDESSSKNTDIFDENGQTINNYKLSDVLAVIFKHGNDVKMNMFDNYVFSGDKWIRTVDMGNGYTAGYQCFGDCHRLLNILAPEMVYFSNFFISRTNTNGKRYSKYSSYKIQIDIGDPGNPNYKTFYTYYYEDSDIDKGWRVIIDGLAYNIKGVDGVTWLNGLGSFRNVSNALKYSMDKNRYYYKLIPITDNINDETNMIIGYMLEDYTVAQDHADVESMINAGWTQQEIEGSTGYGETVFELNNDDVYSINAGYRSETVEVNISSNYSEACKNCYSLINIEFGDKLYSIADEAFLNAGKIKINNNNLYIINNQDITDLGELKSYTNTDFSIQNNHIKYIDKYYNTGLFDNDKTDWKLLARELENDGNIVIYYDAMKIHYHGNNEQFKKVRKKINWNLRERSTKYINLSLTSDNRLLKYKPPTSLTDFNEYNEDFTGNNYFAYTIDDSSIYLDSITAIKKVNNEYVPDDEVTFTVYPMKNYENYLNMSHDTPEYKLGIMAKRTIENLPDVLRQHYLERTNNDIEVRRNSNEFDWLCDSVNRPERLPNNPYYEDNTDLSYYRKRYDDDSYNTMGDRFYSTDMTEELGQYYIKDLNFIVLNQHKINKDLNRKFELNIKSTINPVTNQPNTAFFDTWEYFNPDNVRFYNDDNTGYYCANFDRTHGTNFNTCIFNESSSELINDAINHLNPIFKDNAVIYYSTDEKRTGYNYKRNDISDQDVFRRYNSARKFDNNNGIGKELYSTNDSDFAKLLEASDNNEYLVPRLINYGTTFQYGGYLQGAVGIEMGYTMFGYELPRGRFPAEHPSGISLYNVESTYPTKNYDDKEENYQIDKPNMFLKDIDVTEPLPNEENNNEFYQKVITRYDNNTQYTRHKQFTSIPRSTTNVVIEGETSTENSNKNRFSFIYRIFNITMNNGDVESYTINGWQEENENDNYKIFSNQVTVYNEAYYQNNPSADKTFEFNGVTYHLYDIYNDLHNYCTEISGNTVKIGYAGGIREFTIS